VCRWLQWAPPPQRERWLFDWKMYGGVGTPVVEVEAWCFYDANGVVQTPDGHVRVWTKCLAQKDACLVNRVHVMLLPW
jgi:hypothetical protein